MGRSLAPRSAARGRAPGPWLTPYDMWVNPRARKLVENGRVPPAGFEPAPLPPEGSALSPELRGLVRVAGETLSASGTRAVGGPQGAGRGVPPRSESMPVISLVSAVCESAIDFASDRTT